jgi:hypothetical protein
VIASHLGESAWPHVTNVRPMTLTSGQALDKAERDCKRRKQNREHVAYDIHGSFVGPPPIRAQRLALQNAAAMPLYSLVAGGTWIGADRYRSASDAMAVRSD